MSDRTIVVLHETVWKAVVKDVVAFVTTGGLTWLAAYFESTALQWMVFLLFIVQISGAYRRYVIEGVLTPQRAADMIRDKFGAVATPAQE